ncbi:MAG: hypothetical protein GC193_09680 [Cryomorphaceae bacterium]|nr:hypothetical protein [Cryomorphaceae bacterium]
MKTLVKDIAHIQTGIFAKPAGIGELVYLQSRHFDEYGRLISVLHPDLMAEGISEKHLLIDGDVLFAAKGNKNFAVVYDDHNPAAVASTSFFVLRPTGQMVLSKYLSWFLNSPFAQILLKSQAIGTSIPSISKQTLENLEMSVPSIEIQQSILNISELRDKEKRIKLQIEKLRELQLQQQIINALK